MLDQLPYQLTRGVTATREWLVVSAETVDLQALLLAALGQTYIKVGMQTFFSWTKVSKRLRYHEGEPWCMEHEGGYIACHGSYEEVFEDEEDRCLHRLAAVLCDDAAAFRVLHWCVTNLGGE